MGSITAGPFAGEALIESAVDTVKSVHGFSNGKWEQENGPYFWGGDLSTLTGFSTVEDFAIGNGYRLFDGNLLPGLEGAEKAVVLVTCFWAKSSSLERLSQSLCRLSDKALRRGDGTKIKVFIGLSSRSLLQKLLHTSDPRGYIYPPSTWTAKLGLPSPAQLQGLDMTVKSLFFRPFSVMHPKLMIIDGRGLWMPSYNVSWESWYEGCIHLRGPIVSQVSRFCDQIWRAGASPLQGCSQEQDVEEPNGSILDAGREGTPTPDPFRPLRVGKPAPVVLLPSQHHASFSTSLPLGVVSKQAYPMTPLNVVIMHLITSARSTIQLITPNLTSPPVVDALIRALVRGVNVSITTNRRMMVVEQLVTSLTVTEFWVWRLIRRYQNLQARMASRGTQLQSVEPDLLEEGQARVAIGRLEVLYFRPRATSEGRGFGGFVKSHIKCTLVDDSVVVLGSGNMDRASWYTSQELGIAICDPDIAQQIGGLTKSGLQGQTAQHFP